MILIRVTRKTVLYSASLCLGVPLVVVLAAAGVFKLFADGETKPAPVKPEPSVAQTDAEQPPKSLDPRDYKITAFGTDDGVPSAGSRRKLTLNGVEFVFRWIPEGTFMMGSPSEETDRSDDEVQHEVRIAQGFWALETEVAQGMWTPFMDDNPSCFRSSERLPVENVSWNDCQRYIRALNALNLCPKGFEFALPTEAQWEYACRAGTSSPYSFGDFLNKDVANFDENSSYEMETLDAPVGSTKIVGSNPTNPWGLHDMHGNVAEWTADWYRGYPNDPRTPERRDNRAYRGGSWKDKASRCRSASRADAKASERVDGVGLRLVLVKTDNTPDSP